MSICTMHEQPFRSCRDLACFFFLFLDHADQVVQPKHDYSDNVRQVYQALLMRSKNGRLGKHDTTIVSEQFGVKIRTVQRIWKRGKNQLAQNIPVKVPNSRKR